MSDAYKRDQNFLNTRFMSRSFTPTIFK